MKEKKKQTRMGHEVGRRKWRWIGHTLHKPLSGTRQALQKSPQHKESTEGQRRRRGKVSNETEERYTNLRRNWQGCLRTGKSGRIVPEMKGDDDENVYVYNAQELFAKVISVKNLKKDLMQRTHLKLKCVCKTIL